MEIEKIKDDLYVKKGMLGYRVVHPILKDIEKPFSKGNINWFNLTTGGWSNLFRLLCYVLILSLIILAYNHDIGELRKVAENPCEYCSSQMMQRTFGERTSNITRCGSSTVKLNLTDLIPN